MRFQVVGANAESGDDVDVVLEAASRGEVEKIAHDRGIMVSVITPAVEHMPTVNATVPGGHPPAHPPAPHAPVKKDESPISLVDDEPAPAGDHGVPVQHKHGSITVNANSPSDTAHTGEGHTPDLHKVEAQMEYHILINQALYLLETAVNKHIKDGWEPTGGLTVGMANNALQYFQAIIRRKKPPAA